MAEGGTIKARLEAVQKALDDMTQKFTDEGLYIGNWRMGDMEFAWRCEQLTIVRILTEKLGMSQDELDLYFKETVLEQLTELLPVWKERRDEARRQAIIDGVNPLRPPLDPRSN